jgi:hypothetical protein
MISDDEYLERIVAGIHAVTTDDAQVNWNETINGRQFDVVVRFAVGTMRFLVLVEVKNRTRKASVEDIEAFVTKARDQLANKAVFVTAAGFQSGAVTVAQRHGIDLFTVAFDEQGAELSSTSSLIVMHNIDAPEGAEPELKIGDLEPVLAIEEVTLIYSNGKRHTLPSEQSQMRYYVEKSVFNDGTSLDRLIRSHNFRIPEAGKTASEHFKLKPPRWIKPPDDYYCPQGKVKALDCIVASREARLLSGNIQIDPSSFRQPVIYTNVLTGEATSFSLDQLPLGASRAQPGCFYFLLHPLRYYYCDAIEDDLIRWHMIESFQSGRIIHVTYTQDACYSNHYIPVTDKVILKRLERRLSDYLARRVETAQPSIAPEVPRRWRLPWQRYNKAG